MTAPGEYVPQAPSLWRKKPVEVEALLWTGKNVAQAMKFVTVEFSVNDAGSLFIPTLEGEMEARPGDWVIKGVKGEFYPCKPDIFEATYEPTEAAESTSEGRQP